MKTNRWRKNFNYAAIYSLYVRPIIVTAFVLVAVIVVSKYLLKDLLYASFAILVVLVFYVHFLDAKIDMLKRTLDEKSKYKDTKYLWIEVENSKTL